MPQNTYARRSPRRSAQDTSDTPPRDRVELGQTLEFMRVLWELHHGLEKASRRMEASLGVTGQQRLVLRMIGRFPDASAGEIARILHVHPSTLTLLVRRLEKRGMLRRRRHPSDGRMLLFELTARGRAVDSRRSGTIESMIGSVLSGLGAVRVTASRNVLQALADRLLGWSESARTSTNGTS